MQTNNQYYKTICENMNIPIEAGVHNNNYYLKKIATVGYGKSYTDTVCNGILIKDIAEAITGSTYTGHHFTNFFLKEIASVLSPGGDYNNKYDNYLLQVWADNCIVEKINTVLSLTTPVITVTDEFDVSGHLEDADGNNLNGLTVKLLCDNVQVATANTDNEGNVRFHRSAVTTRTNYTFQLIFDGDINYAGSTSSIETVMPNKETTVFDISSPINDATNYTDSDVLVSGRLIDNDGQAVANKTIYIYEQWNMKDWGSTTTDSNGYFSKSLDYDSYLDRESRTQLTTSLHIFFLGDNEFTRVDQYIDGIVKKPYISLESDKSILSKADDDEAVLTATLYSSDKVDKAVSFDIVDSQGTVLSHLGDDDTGSDGKASFTYESQGVGDIIVQASATVNGMFVSKTYEVCDAIKHIASTTVPLSFDISIPSNFQFSMKYRPVNRTRAIAQLNFADSNSKVIQFGQYGSDGSNGIMIDGTIHKMGTSVLNTENIVTGSYNNGVCSITLNGTTQTVTTSLQPVKFTKVNTHDSNNGITISDIIIKPL